MPSYNELSIWHSSGTRESICHGVSLLLGFVAAAWYWIRLRGQQQSDRAEGPYAPQDFEISDAGLYVKNAHAESRFEWDAFSKCKVDDKLLGSTSNAVERGNRRFRKAQSSIYSVRTKEHLEQRLALDMHREQRAPKRRQTMKTLQVARSKPDSLH